MKFSAGHCQDEPGLPAVAAIQRSKGGLFLFHKLSDQLLTHQKYQISGRNLRLNLSPGHVIKFFQREEKRTILPFAPMCHTVCRLFSEVRRDRKHWESLGSHHYIQGLNWTARCSTEEGGQTFRSGLSLQFTEPDLCEKKRCSSLLSLRPQTDGSDSFSSL